MFKVSAPRSADPLAHSDHRYGHEWLSHFDRQQRHQLVDDDRQARGQVARVLFGAMLFGLTMLVVLLLRGI